MTNWWLEDRLCTVLLALVAMSLMIGASGSPALAQEAKEEPAEAVAEEKPADAPEDAATQAGDEKEAGSGERLEQDFNNYLHFALIGKFDVADTYGESLLKHPDLAPKLTDQGAERLVGLTDKYEHSIETLITIINNSTIGENAKKILRLIREAHLRKRMDPARIKENIKLLAGDPMQRVVGLERLIDTGEYAVPWMLRTLADAKQDKLHPFVVRALPQLGKPAVNPLTEALKVEDESVRHFVAEALGKIGYPQALPYLKRITSDDKASEAARKSAAQAIEQIVVGDPGVKEKPAAELFRDLAEQYYAEVESLQPDPRDTRVNVWSYRQEHSQPVLEPTEVPRDIFSIVMCMRCSEASLTLEADQPAVVALWLAANFRRESRLGLDVESEETVAGEALDATRPPGFPRGIYFARSAGPAYCQRVLTRAIKDRDRDVALGAIAALSVTAGPAAMLDPQDAGGMGLPAALFFPDLLVRLKAALALGRAMPQTPFRGSQEVVPVLASVLSPADRKFYMLVEADAALREVIEEGLTRTGATVAVADRLGPALNRAHGDFAHLDGVFLASNMERPTAIEAIRELTGDDRFALAPIVVFVKTSDTLMTERIKEVDKRIGFVFEERAEEGAPPNPRVADLLLKEAASVAARFGYRQLSPEQSLSLAMEAAATLGGIATTGSPLFDVRIAQPALIDALETHPSEELRVASAAVLSWLDAAAAQQAIARAALGTEQSEPLRMAAFGALADSARRFGARLDDAMTKALIDQGIREPNLALRTAASRALGAMNLPGYQAAKIIIGQQQD